MIGVKGKSKRSVSFFLHKFAGAGIVWPRTGFKLLTEMDERLGTYGTFPSYRWKKEHQEIQI